MRKAIIIVLATLLFASATILWRWRAEIASFAQVAQIVIAFAAVVGIYLNWHAIMRERDLRNTRDLQAGNMALYHVFRAYESFKDFENKSILGHLDNPFKSVFIRPCIGLEDFNLDINFNDLAFISDTKHASLLLNLIRFERDIMIALEIIKKRDKLHIAVIQPAIEKISAGSAAEFSPKRLLEEIGLRNKTELEQLTEDMITTTRHVIIAAEDLQNKMQNALCGLFRKREAEVIKFIRSNKPF